jgi:uncharacterized protein (TIGR03382 family)
VGSRGLGEPCATDDECRGDMVCNTSAGISECASSCAGGAACPDGFECRADLCIRDRRQGVGGICEEQADCGDAICAEQGDREWCTAICSGASDCPTGFDCVAAGGTRVCAPTLSLEGEACAIDVECATGLCALIGDSGVCSSVCDADNACAPGLECRRTGSGTTAVCIPAPRPATGGCSAASVPAGGASAWLLALVAAAMLARRRR